MAPQAEWNSSCSPRMLHRERRCVPLPTGTVAVSCGHWKSCFCVCGDWPACGLPPKNMPGLLLHMLDSAGLEFKDNTFCKAKHSLFSPCKQENYSIFCSEASKVPQSVSPFLSSPCLLQSVCLKSLLLHCNQPPPPSWFICGSDCGTTSIRVFPEWFRPAELAV